MTDHLEAARGRLGGLHDHLSRREAALAADDLHAILSAILDHLQQSSPEPGPLDESNHADPLTFAPRPADAPTTAPQPAQVHGDADEPARPELNVQTESWNAIYNGGEIVSSAGFSAWLAAHDAELCAQITAEIDAARIARGEKP